MGTGTSGVCRVGWQAGDSETLTLQRNALTLMADACKLGIQFSHLQGETLGSVFSWFSSEATGDEDVFWGRCRNFWVIYGTLELGI